MSGSASAIFCSATSCLTGSLALAGSNPFLLRESSRISDGDLLVFLPTPERPSAPITVAFAATSVGSMSCPVATACAAVDPPPIPPAPAACRSLAVTGFFLASGPRTLPRAPNASPSAAPEAAPVAIPVGPSLTPLTAPCRPKPMAGASGPAIGAASAVAASAGAIPAIVPGAEATPAIVFSAYPSGVKSSSALACMSAALPRILSLRTFSPTRYRGHRGVDQPRS